MSASVVTKNFFALLDDDDAPKSANITPAPNQDAPAAPAPARGSQRSRGGPASRGGKYYQRGGGKSAAPRDENGDIAEGDADAPKKRFDGEGRGRGRGRGRGGDRGGDRGSTRGRGRPFDRHSATGKTDSDKKIHQGWGGDEGETELKAEDAAVADAAAEPVAENSGWGDAAATDDAWGGAEATAGEPDPTAAPAAASNETEAAAEGRRGRDREPEEEDNTLTFDQYQKQQKEKELDLVPKLETRKANEGDDSFFKDAIVVKPKDEDETAYFVGKSKAAVPKSRAKKEEKVFIEIDARFERPRGGRGGGRGGDRGGDRGDRGPRGGGRARGGRGRAYGNGTPALNVDDEAAFPTLA